ncbi:uncharacterized protein TRAVEDRAFT_53238 [Trametes versicolor FP-101664 SS1]|uniref:uncharacterized protein n=1 Tax=Trametes versicolor (strain FP-101664) TaxID=717944 RepID=UPI0004622362|nr:uncharacterized protein TRAVEDRAFT_53238 [Trametes versicolor FP-101664 SS1]EIW52798.1 hypothetical protein TRAVEDRAFT_53238 [Trametes versicolor FP-101664 SS1]
MSVPESDTHMIGDNGTAWPFQPSMMAYIPPTSATTTRLDNFEPGQMDVWPGRINNPYVPQASAVPQLPIHGSSVTAIGNAVSIGHQALQSSPDSNLLALGHHGPDPRQWIIPHTIYAGGPPPDTPVPPAVLSIFVGDILDLGRLARLKTMDLHHVPAFPDPEGYREKKKFTVRFAFEGIPINEDPPQVNEYRKPEGSAKRVPLTRTDFAVVVVKQLCKFLCGKQLRLRGRVVDVGHLVILEIGRPSKGSVQPVFMIHPHFWPLYA